MPYYFDPSIDQGIAFLQNASAPPLAQPLGELKTTQTKRKVSLGAAGAIMTASIVGVWLCRWHFHIYWGKEIKWATPATLLALPLVSIPLSCAWCQHSRAKEQLGSLMASHAAMTGCVEPSWDYLQTHGHQLAKLTLYPQIIDQACLLRVVEACPQLTHLSLEKGNFDHPMLEALGARCRKVTHLKLQGTSDLDDESYEVLSGQNFPSLDHLSIANAPDLTTAGLTHLGHKNWTTLTISASQIGKGAAEALGTQAKLAKLELGSRDIDPREFADLDRFPELTELVLHVPVDRLIAAQVAISMGPRWVYKGAGSTHRYTKKQPQPHSSTASVSHASYTQPYTSKPYSYPSTRTSTRSNAYRPTRTSSYPTVSPSAPPSNSGGLSFGFRSY